MGEGAIEGKGTQYEMVDKSAVDFAFSRFRKTASFPRNVSALSGIKRMRTTSAISQAS
jgi:hypothetical protein